MKKCLKCGEINNDSAKACAYCGASFEKKLSWNDVINSKNKEHDDLFGGQDLSFIPYQENKKESEQYNPSEQSIPKNSSKDDSRNLHTSSKTETSESVHPKENTSSFSNAARPVYQASKKQNSGFRSILIVILSLGISFVLYKFVVQTISQPSSDYDDFVEEESTQEELSFSQPVGEAGQLIGSWKYEIFPGKNDASEYLIFRSDGTFEMYENPGAMYATHCQGKQSGTYSFDGTNLTLNYMNATWPYTVSWTDGNSFNLTYVSQVNTCTRVSDDEYNYYVN